MPETPGLPERPLKPLGPQDWVRDLVKENPLAPKNVPPTPLATPGTAAPVITPTPAPLGTPVPAPVVDATKPVVPPVVDKPVDAPAPLADKPLDAAPTPAPVATKPSTATPPPAQK